MVIKHVACNLCEAICGLEVTVEDDKIISIRGDKNDPLSRGHICPKALALQDIHEDPDRLTRPVKRVGDTWQEISWHEAIETTARELARIRLAHGPDAVGLYAGNPTVHSLGAMTHGTTFGSMLRTRNRYSATSVDQLPHQLVSQLLYGHQFLLPIPDIDHTEHMIIIGANPAASNGSIMTAPDFVRRLKAVRQRGKVVVIDPRRTETARLADEHHFIRPGTDAALLMSMLHVILADDDTNIPGIADGIDGLRLAVQPFTPEMAAGFTGVSAEAITRLAREFAASPTGVVYGRMGVSTQSFGTLCHWAIQILNLVTGNLDRRGGAIPTSPAIDLVGRGVVGPGHLGKWRTRVRGLPEFSGESPSAAMAEEMLTPGDGQVRGFVVTSGNPVLSTPDGAAMDRAFASLEFMVAVDFYVNETTRHADIILPPTHAMTRDHYDLIFQAFAVRNTARFTRAPFPREPGAMHDWEIYRDLGLAYRRHLGVSPQKRLSPRSLITEARLRLSPTRTVDLLLRTRKGQKLSVRKLLSQPSGIDLGPLEPGLFTRLKTKNQRIDVLPGLVSADLPRLLETISVGADPDGLLLIGRRHMRSNNSWMHQYPRLVKGAPRHQLLMNPEDLKVRDLAEGSTVKVRSRSGMIEVDVVASDEMAAGVVSLPHGFGHGRGGTGVTVADTVPGVSMNDLTDRELLDPTSGNAVLNGVPVTVEAVRG